MALEWTAGSLPFLRNQLESGRAWCSSRELGSPSMDGRRQWASQLYPWGYVAGRLRLIRVRTRRNRDLAERLFGPEPHDLQAKRRRTARVSRLIQLSHAHGLIAKIPHAQRYRLTEKGQAIMNAAVYVR
jgi:hypothetical protein